MITAIAIILSAISALCALAIGALTSRQQRVNVHEANEIDRFEAITTALERRVSDLEKELGRVKSALDAEQNEHRRTREDLRQALRYIRELIRWGQGATNELPPSPPPELAIEL